ncbi:MAG: Rpn family recombination-promoting nuclease/putative transposase, partial [Synergistaceae bacterium]|nr:Rpn family recombination-promoting nuclease/putative transposase [Synergistaceae bacterium]
MLTENASRGLPKDTQQVDKEFKEGKVRRLSDSLFKFVFCKKNNSSVFLDMVNALVYPDGGGVFKKAKFLDREHSPEHQGAKGGRFDVVALMDGRDTVNIEAQIAPDQYFVERAVIYLSWVHGDKVERGKRYGTAGQTISVHILEYEQFAKEHYRSSFSYRDEETGEALNDGTRLIFFEVNKFLRSVKVPNNKMERWLAYFANVGGKKMEQIAEQEPGIKEALSAEKIFMQNRESYLAYMHDWKLIMQERSYKVQLSAALEQAAAESEARAKA